MPGVPASAVGFVAGALTRFALSYWHVFAPSRGMTAAGTAVRRRDRAAAAW